MKEMAGSFLAQATRMIEETLSSTTKCSLNTPIRRALLMTVYLTLCQQAK